MVARENEPKACADEKRCGKEQNGAMAKCEHDVSDNVESHPRTDEVDEVSLVDEATRHDAVQDEACGNEGVKPSRAAKAKFFSVKRNVVRDRPVSESDEDEVCKLRYGTCQKEPV